MSKHITVNGQTYAGVEDMPPDVRREYETAMQLLAKNAGSLANAPNADINVSASGVGPHGVVFKSSTKLTTDRIVVNGKEYLSWEEVPSSIRTAFKAAGAGGQTPLTADLTRSSNVPYPGHDSSSSFSFSVGGLIVLLGIVLLVGILIGYGLHHL